MQWEGLLHLELVVRVDLLHRHLFVVQGEGDPGLQGGFPLLLPFQLPSQVYNFEGKWEGELY